MVHAVWFDGWEPWFLVEIDMANREEYLLLSIWEEAVADVSREELGVVNGESLKWWREYCVVKKTQNKELKLGCEEESNWTVGCNDCCTKSRRWVYCEDWDVEFGFKLKRNWVWLLQFCRLSWSRIGGWIRRWQWEVDVVVGIESHALWAEWSKGCSQIRNGGNLVYEVAAAGKWVHTRARLDVC